MQLSFAAAVKRLAYSSKHLSERQKSPKFNRTYIPIDNTKIFRIVHIKYDRVEANLPPSSKGQTSTEFEA